MGSEAVPRLRPDEEKEAKRIMEILMDGPSAVRLEKLTRFVVYSLQATHYTNAREIAELIAREVDSPGS